MEHMTPVEIMDHLEEMFPDAHCELDHRNNYEMAVAVVLSAQTTDASVNRVTPALFAKYPVLLCFFIDILGFSHLFDAA